MIVEDKGKLEDKGEKKGTKGRNEREEKRDKEGKGEGGYAFTLCLVP